MHYRDSFPVCTVPEILVCTRFGLRVKDRAWLTHRLELISAITAPSLMAQRDQSFNWVVLIDDGLPDDIRHRLEDVLRPFGDRAYLYQRAFHTPESLLEMVHAQGISERNPYLLTARIDDDDAWGITMVGSVRERVASWLNQSNRAPGLSLTFQDGLEWVMYEMLDVETFLNNGERVIHPPAIRNYRLPIIGMSVFVCSSISDGMTAMAGAHSRVGERLSSLKGFAVDVVSTDLPMWLCCRHKQTGSGTRKANGTEVQLGHAELAARFGLDEHRVKNYLERANEYEYNLIKTPLPRKRKLIVELFQLDQDIKDLATNSDRLSQLLRRKEELSAELAQLEVNVLGNPDALSSPKKLQG
jgi:hypothetical protein